VIDAVVSGASLLRCIHQRTSTARTDHRSFSRLQLRTGRPVVSEVRIAAEQRTEFGKGAARRIRRADRVPAVLYGHGTDPRHISLPGHDLMMALKTPNVLLSIDLGGATELALPKDVQRDPVRGFLEHVDLVVVKRGEKVTVEVPVHVVGDIVNDGLLQHDLTTLAVEAEATRIPQAIEVQVEGLPIGASTHAKDIALPVGASLVTDAEAVVVHVTAAPTAEQIEAELFEGEAAEAVAEGAEAAAAEPAVGAAADDS
jgi:large subunit ribosomal protein L25